MSERTERERSIARRFATTLAASFFVLWVSRLVLGISTGSLADQETWLSDVIYGVGILVFSGLFLLVGRTIVTRQPWNTIGWLLLAIPLTWRVPVGEAR
jgi:predicted branched-subunit amino acid permease